MSDSAEMPPPSEVPMTKQEQVVIEKQQENLLKQKYPQAARGRPAMGGAPPSSGGHSAFLQKRLAKGQKYFDSGDYQMAKQKSRGAPGARLAMPVLAQPTGDTIPTPELVPGTSSELLLL